MAGSGISLDHFGLNTALVTLAGSGTPTVASNPTVVASAGVNVVTTCATTGDSILLPANMPQFSKVTVYNSVATVTVDVFPNAGATLNGGTASTGQRGIATQTGATFTQVGTDGLTWWADNTIAAVS